MPNIDKGLMEVRRVLKKGGQFYCATYGEHGIMKYLSEVLSAYGVDDNINKNFTLQNGYEILNKIFSKVKKLEYIDSLEITNIEDMMEYTYSLSN
ncbi:MAG: class I SAM-dependent methyltransferase, partial [Clostridia bacterium]|nr:class I SAM-dependent methyltransferase [Clostridia bacterium]